MSGCDEPPARPPESEERREFRRRAASLGLSTVHIPSPQRSGTLRVAVGGSLVRLRGDRMDHPVGGPRGVVHGFSRASRRRMLRWIQSLDRERAGMPLFVTLTYPRDWPGSPRRWKRDLEVWLARLKREHPEAWALWRLEPQRRGAPHYHLLVFGLPALDKDWISLSWYEVVDSGDERHLGAGTQVQSVASWNRVIGYVAKYLAKEAEDLPAGWRDGVGRWWGVHNRKIAPREAMEVEVGGPGFFKVRRVLRRLVAGPGSSRRRWFSDGRDGLGGIRRRGQTAGLGAATAERLLRWAQGRASE